MAEAKTPATPTRLRAAGPHAQRAAASMLRLARRGETDKPGGLRLPSGQALTSWLERAAVPLLAES